MATRSPESSTRLDKESRHTAVQLSGWLLAVVAIANALLAGLVVCASLVAACQGSGADQVTSPIVLGMTDQLTPIIMTQQLTMYEVQVPVPLPVRKPTSQEESSLGGAVAPYPHQPFLLDSDESLEIHFTISNLDTDRHAVYLLPDRPVRLISAVNRIYKASGLNDLEQLENAPEYRPGVTVVDNETPLPNPSGYQKSFLIDPMSRVEGTITTDDTTALAVGLATAMQILSLPVDPMAAYPVVTLVDHTFAPQNRPLSNDPLVSQYIPSTIAGLTGFDLGLRADTAENVSVEIVVDITDLNGNRLVPQGQTGATIGVPRTILSPAAAPAPGG